MVPNRLRSLDHVVDKSGEWLHHKRVQSCSVVERDRIVSDWFYPRSTTTSSVTPAPVPTTLGSRIVLGRPKGAVTWLNTGVCGLHSIRDRAEGAVFPLRPVGFRGTEISVLCP